jgi:hypothetical protein
MLALVVTGGVFLFGFSSAVAFSTPPPPLRPTLAPVTAQTAGTLSAEMDLIEQQVKDLRHWDSVRPVPRNLYDLDALRDYNIRSFEKDYGPEEARDDVLSLAAFGLLDPSFDLYTLYIDLYSEDILGLYDPDLAELFIITERSAFGSVERSTFAHEYLHALQDQNHGFEALGWNDAAFDEDAQRFGALQAFMEGEAMLLESQWQMRHFTQPDWEDYNAHAYADPGSAFFRAPDWLQQDFYFPYLQGYDFVNALYERGGWAEVDRAYDRIPASTEMILHLDKYDAGELPDPVPAPDLAGALGPGWRVVDSNSQGEWYTFLILEAFIDAVDARTAAAGWDGDRYAVAYHDGGGQLAAAWHLAWDTTGDAEEFIDAFKAYGDARFGTAGAVGEGRLCWEAAGLETCLYFTPQATLWILAPDQDSLDKVRAAIDF